MSDKIREIIVEIEAMKVKLGEEIAEQESHISYEIQNGYVKFEKDVIEKLKENMKDILDWISENPLLHLLT
jgi:cob(I)alamin adenosyltransferase